MENYNYIDNLPQELKEEIFKHLCLSDFLNLSLTSRRLNFSVGNSSFCMSKIWIKFYSFNLKDFTSLSNSVRNYEKLKVNRMKNEQHFEFLIRLQQNFKKVLIYNCEFKKFSLFYDLIESLAENIEEIEISDVEILSYEDFKILPLKFPSIKRIMFRNVPSRAIEIFLSIKKSLKIAAFDIPQVVAGSLSLHTITNEILHSSPNLKLLQLGPQYIRELFQKEKDIDTDGVKLNNDNHDFDYNFKLTNLLFKFPIVDDLTYDHSSAISNFILQQSKVNWIVFMELQNDQILSAAWRNKLLKRISFVGLEELFHTDMIFEIDSNLSFTHIDFISRKVLISQLRKILTAAPNVISIFVKILNKHMLEFIAKNCKIQTLFYEHIEEDVCDMYDDLKKELEHVNQDIKLTKKSFWFNDENPFSIDPIFWKNE